jgi:hypothetical protein
MDALSIFPAETTHRRIINFSTNLALYLFCLRIIQLRLMKFRNQFHQSIPIHSTHRTVCASQLGHTMTISSNRKILLSSHLSSNQPYLHQNYAASISTTKRSSINTNQPLLQ